MAKNITWHNTARASIKKKHRLMLLCPILISVMLIVAFSTVSSASILSSNSPTKTAEPGTQFKLEVPYVYIGKGPSNACYLDTNGLFMRPESEYPSAVYFNLTLLSKTETVASDAKIEVYSIQIASDKGSTENYAYFVGTNYDPSFSQAELEALTRHIYNLIDLNTVSGVKGDFNFNWTENTSILSHSAVGSTGSYSTSPSKLGLWSAGTPNSISITIHRIGYVTMSEGSVSVYRDAVTNVVTDMTLHNSQNIFIENTLIPVDQLSQQTDLFHPQTK